MEHPHEQNAALPGAQGPVDARRDVAVALLDQRIARLFLADLGPGRGSGGERRGGKLVFFNQQFGRLGAHQCGATFLEFQEQPVVPVPR